MASSELMTWLGNSIMEPRPRRKTRRWVFTTRTTFLSTTTWRKNSPSTIATSPLCSVLRFRTAPNLMAATSFGHLTSADTFPPPGGYRPITGTIFDLLNENGVSWADYFQDAPQGASFLPFGLEGDPHFLPTSVFLGQAAGNPLFGPLPQVSFVDPT